MDELFSPWLLLVPVALMAMVRWYAKDPPDDASDDIGEINPWIR